MSDRTCSIGSKLIGLAAAMVILGRSPAALAFGDTCSNVKIKLTNDTDVEIKVTQFEYYDYSADKWRLEVMFGVDGFQKIEAGQTWSKTQDLEHVENDKTKFKVTYKTHVGGTDWGSATSVDTDSFECKDEMSKTVVISGGVSPAALDSKDCTSQQQSDIAEAINWGATNWSAFEKRLEDIRDWPVDIGACLEGRFKADGKVVCEAKNAGPCDKRNGWANFLTKKCHICPDFLNKMATIKDAEDRQACYFALITHEWGHTCGRGHKTLEIIDDEAFDFWKDNHSGVTISYGGCGMD